MLAPVTRDRRVVEFSTLSTHLTEPRRLIGHPQLVAMRPAGSFLRRHMMAA
jgi:hypothetical protein